MAYFLNSAIQVSLNNSTWYKLTDHNREPIELSFELIESQNRMANGSLRKYIIAKKSIISTSWNFVPTKTSETADGNYGAAWLESFYNANAGIPIYVKLIISEIDPDIALGSIPLDANFKTALTGEKVYTVFMTEFSKNLLKRTRVSDYVDMNIQFTEI
jgi:hypothetical protein